MDIITTWSKDLDGQDRKIQNEALDREVERFSLWLSRLEDTRASGALNNPEKALIKTYLVQKMLGKIDEVA